MTTDKLIHIVKKGQEETLCAKSILEITHHRYKWMHPYEVYKKKLIVHKELDMPTCPVCLHILNLMGIDIEKDY